MFMCQGKNFFSRKVVVAASIRAVNLTVIREPRYLVLAAGAAVAAVELDHPLAVLDDLVAELGQHGQPRPRQPHPPPGPPPHQLRPPAPQPVEDEAVQDVAEAVRVEEMLRHPDQVDTSSGILTSSTALSVTWARTSLEHREATTCRYAKPCSENALK